MEFLVLSNSVISTQLKILLITAGKVAIIRSAGFLLDLDSTVESQHNCRS